jgi:hypothetical protein
MFNKHFFSFIAACTIAAATLFWAFTPSTNLPINLDKMSSSNDKKVKIAIKTAIATTDPNVVDCSCTFSSGGCAECTCSGGFATGCGAAIAQGRAENMSGNTKPFNVSMSDKQLRQALKYQRLLLSLDSPEAIAAASQVSQLIEAIQDGKTELYQQVAEQYHLTQGKLPKAEKEMVDTWIDNKKIALEKSHIPAEKLSEKDDKN